MFYELHYTLRIPICQLCFICFLIYITEGAVKKESSHKKERPIVYSELSLMLVSINNFKNETDSRLTSEYF